MRGFRAALLLTLGVLLCLPVRSEAAFTRRCTIVVQAAQVTGTLADFPVLIKKTDNDLKLIAGGGYVANSNGYDIRVFSDTSLTVAIPFELVYYDGTAGTFIAYAKIGSMATSATYYLGFGDAALNTNASSTSTWRSEYKGVWHGSTDGGATVSLADSTSNGNTLTLGGSGTTATAGQISGAFNFNGSGWATAGDQPSLDIPSGLISYSAWVYFPISTVDTMVMNKQSGSGEGYDMLIGPGFNPGQVAIRTKSHEVDAFALNDAWHLIYGTTSSTNLNINVDGGAQSATTSATAGSFASTTEFQIGAREGTKRGVEKVEEVRVYEGTLSGDWSAAEYKSQNAPATFASYTFDAAPTPPSNAFPFTFVASTQP